MVNASNEVDCANLTCLPLPKALDLLHSCVQGSIESIARLDSILEETRSLNREVMLKRRAQAAAQPPEDRDSRSARARMKGRAWRGAESLKPHPDTEPILSRPRPQVSGLRRVPVLVNARGVPFLRIKKPQPPSLTRALRSKLDHRWKRIVRRERLENELLLAKDENYWDELVGERDPPSWTASISSSLKDVNTLLQTGDQKNALLAQKMWEVVMREQELAKLEKEERRRLRRENSLMKMEESSVIEATTLHKPGMGAQANAATYRSST
jgi:hypothetical protein